MDGWIFVDAEALNVALGEHREAPHPPEQATQTAAQTVPGASDANQPNDASGTPTADTANLDAKADEPTKATMPRRTRGQKKGDWQGDLKTTLDKLLRQAPGTLRQVGGKTWAEQHDWITRRWKSEGLASKLPVETSGNYRTKAGALIDEAVAKLPDKPLSA